MDEPEETVDAVVIPLPGMDLAPRDPATLIPMPPPALPELTVWDVRVIPDHRTIRQWFTDCWHGLETEARVWAIHVTRSHIYYGHASRYAHIGLGRSLAAWWRWVRDHESIQRRRAIPATSQADPVAQRKAVADELQERKVRVRWRWSVTGVLAFACLCLELWMRHRYPTGSPLHLRYLAGDLITTATLMVVLLVLGLIGAQPGQIVDQVRIPLQVMPTSPEIILAAVKSGYGVEAKPETWPTVPPPGVRREAGGYAVRLILAPGTKHAEHVVVNQAVFAANLGTDVDGIDVARVPGRGLEVDVWFTYEDVLSRPAQTTPLVTVGGFDLWQPLRLGTVARGTPALVAMPWTSWLVGGQPRMGKTFLLRLLAMAVTLDPHAALDVWDFKPQGDWLWCEDTAAQATLDDSPEAIKAYGEHLKWLRHSELPRRRRVLTELTREDRSRCPEGKLTPELTRDRGLNLGWRVVITDEIQVPVGVGGKLKTQILEDKADLARRGPASGIIMVDSSQRMDEDSVPKGLRAAYASRLALKVEDALESRLITGKPTESGWDASKLPGEEGQEGWVLGVGFGVPRGPLKFRTDLATSLNADEVARRVLGDRGPRELTSPHPAPDSGQEVPDVLRAALAAWPRGQMTCHQDVLAQAMGWDQIDVGRAMRQEHLETCQVKAPSYEDGVVRNRRGYYLADLEAAAR